MGRDLRCSLLAALLFAAAAIGAAGKEAWPVTIEPPPVLVRPQGSSGGLWSLTFADEFDGPGVDAAKWSNGFGWGDTAANFAAWCDPTANAVVEGVLVQR